MLGSFALAAAALVQVDTVVPQSPPSLPDHRSQFATYPAHSVLTAEWSCKSDGKPSRATLTIDDVGRGVRNETFRSELTAVSVAGRAPTTKLLERIAAAVAELTTVPDIKGKCVGQSPVLTISGFTRTGTVYVPRNFEFELD